MTGFEPLAEPMRLAVFASGSGTNMEAITRAAETGALSAEIVLCVCNKPGAGVITRAESRRIPVALLDPRDFPDERAYVQQLLRTLETHRVNFIALAGYMRKIPADVVGAFPGRMLNIHPALLPCFGGKGMYGHHVHEAVIAYGVRWTGVTVHIVDNEYDHGPIVLQEPIEVLQDDTPDSLAERIHPVEHRLYPQALQLFAQGRIRLSGRRILMHPPESSVQRS